MMMMMMTMLEVLMMKMILIIAVEAWGKELLFCVVYFSNQTNRNESQKADYFVNGWIWKTKKSFLGWLFREEMRISFDEN